MPFYLIVGHQNGMPVSASSPIYPIYGWARARFQNEQGQSNHKNHKTRREKYRPKVPTQIPLFQRPHTKYFTLPMVFG